ncbi:MAG: exonuclease subunit SbcD [Lachnospiraceae bacterium]|nr:exonuclease subunit SbcD [Lachnospiraceae bacterium]
MRILHTADWHLGNTMHNIDRQSEQEAFLDWLLFVVKDRQIDTLIVAGDVFDTYTPPNWAQKIYYRFLASLITTKCRNVILVGGNHDSGNLLDAPREILDAINIHVVGNIGGKNIEDMVFPLSDEEGQICGVAAAVPYVSEIMLKDFCEAKEYAKGTFSDAGFSGLYGAFLEKAKALTGGKTMPLIATGHLYAAGLEGRYEGVEEEQKTDDGVRQIDVVGNLGKVHAASFPDEFDYVALGHIHYQSRVDHQDRIRYSGSPFVMGFDEDRIPRYVLQVDLTHDDNGKNLSVEKIEVPAGIKFRRLSGKKEEIEEKLKEVLGKDHDSEFYDKLCIEICYDAGDGPALHELVENTDFHEKVSVVSWKPGESRHTYQADFGGHDMHSMSNIQPKEIIRELVLSKTELDTEGKTEEEIEKLRDAEVKTYLPYFLEAFDAVMSGGDYEDQ